MNYVLWLSNGTVSVGYFLLLLFCFGLLSPHYYNSRLVASIFFKHQISTISLRNWLAFRKNRRTETMSKVRTYSSVPNKPYVWLIFFGKKVLCFFLIKCVWFILFWKSGPLYGLLSAYELLKKFFILTHFKWFML